MAHLAVRPGVQLDAQSREPSTQARLHGAAGHGQHLGGLGLVQLEQVAAGDDGAQRDREPVEEG